MAKMNLDFLLLPESNASARSSERLSEAHSSSRNDSSPFSLDYIAPQGSSSDHHRSRHGHRRTPESHSFSRLPTPSSSRSQASKEPSPVPSRHNFKSKKTKQPAPPAPKSQSSAEVKPHVCRSCDRSFYKLEQLKRHDRLVHLNLRPFECKTCELSFGTKQNMQVHLTTRKHKHRLETLQSESRLTQGGSSSRNHR